MKKSAWVFVLLCVLVFGFVSTSLAATFTVNSTGTTSDANDGDGICADSTGACTIIAAIDEANSLSGADEITFSVDGMFDFTGRDLLISESLTLTGNGSNTTIFSGALSIVSGVGGSSADLTISELGIQSFLGDPGTAAPITINLGSSLTLTDCTVSGIAIEASGYGAIYNDGTLTITRSTLSGNSIYPGLDGNGGALYNTGTATIEASTLSGNSVSGGATNHGGAIYNTGTLNLNNSTISGNSAQNNGGGIYNASTGTLYLFSSTIAYNTADSAAANAGSGGGIYNDGGTVLARNNIIAENIDNSSTAPDCAGTLGHGSYNLIEDTTGCTVSALTNTLTGASGLNSTLTDNGGSTNTHALTSTSAAVDSAGVCSDSDGAPLATDQRGTGYTREYNSSCDRGAFEYIGTETTCTDDVDEDNDGAADCDDSDCSTTSECANCGDETVQDSEECDDGGAPPVSGDGCSETCQIETTWYADSDGDSYGNTSSTVQSTTQPTGYVTTGGDCDDTSASVNPDATDIDDDLDNDCDGETDEGCTTYYEDADGDGYGNLESTETACTQPDGFVADATDCNDGEAAINPGAAEVCNGGDDDCDGQEDDGVSYTYYVDADGDGYGEDNGGSASCEATPSVGFVTTTGDCDDSNSSINTSATETCGDAIDQDCDDLDLACSSESNAEDDDTLLDAAEVADGGEVSDDAVEVEALDDGVTDGDTGETVTPPSDDGADDSNDGNNADSDGGSGGGCSLNTKQAGSAKNLSFLIFLLPFLFFRGRLEYRNVILRRSDMSKFFLQAVTSFLIAHLVFLPTLAQAQMKGTALQPPQSPPESVRSLKPGQFITFKDKDDDLVYDSLYFSFDEPKSLLEQISDKVVDKNAQNCATLLLKDSLYKGMAAKSLNGPVVIHTDMLKPMEKDCGGVWVKLVPVGVELTPQKMTELRKDDPLLVQMIDRSLGIQEAQAGLALAAGVAFGLGFGVGLFIFGDYFQEETRDAASSVRDAVEAKVIDALNWCEDPAHSRDEACQDEDDASGTNPNSPDSGNSGGGSNP